MDTDIPIRFLQGGRVFAVQGEGGYLFNYVAGKEGNWKISLQRRSNWCLSAKGSSGIEKKSCRDCSTVREMMPYRYLEDVAIADVAFQAWGETLEELFTAAVDATLNVMVQNLSEIREKIEKRIELRSDTLDTLLVELLEEIIYWKDVERLLLRVRYLVIRKENGEYSLKAKARGEELDPDRHLQLVDVKAVTFYRLRVEKSANGWEAEVILDI